MPARRPRGNPNLVKGGPSLNPSGKAKEQPEPVADEAGGVVTAGRMRKVLAQEKRADRGPTEQTLRAWLEKDPKGFIAAAEERERLERGEAEVRAEVERLRAENEELRAAAEPAGGGPDAGAGRCLALLDEWLADPAKWEGQS